MRLITMLAVSCLLLVSLSPIAACNGQRQQKYQYYITLSNQYEAAAISEDQQGQYYMAFAEQLTDNTTESGRQEYQKFKEVADIYFENAKKYREVAKQYRDLASKR